MGNGSGGNTSSYPSRGRTGSSSGRRGEESDVRGEGKTSPPEEIRVEEEFSTCPRCGYGAGFHVAFRRRGRPFAPQAASRNPPLRPGSSGCRHPRNGARHGRSRPKEEGGVRLSAAVRVHRTASHERSPLRGGEADAGALRQGGPMRPPKERKRS